MQDARYLAVSVPVYHWDDSILDGDEDLEGRMPCRRGDLWEPLIELATGKIVNWTAGHTARVSHKVRDEGQYWLLDQHKARIARWKDAYVPNDLLHMGGNGFGDYIFLPVDADGQILDWKVPVLQPDEWVPLTELDAQALQVKTARVPVSLEQQLTHRELAPGVSGFELVRRFHPVDIVPAWCQGVLQDSRTTGLTTTSEVQRFLAGECTELCADPVWRLVSPEYLQVAQQHGYVEAESNIDLEPALLAANQHPLALPVGWSVVRNDFRQHLLFDTDGQVLSVGLLFDYLNGMVRDGCYDIPRLVDYLNQHPQVHPVKRSGQQRLTVERIPVYNARPGCTLHTSFVFAPTAQQMRLLWEKAQQLKPSYPSTALHEAVFELDLLGLRAQSIATSDRYCGDAEY